MAKFERPMVIIDGVHDISESVRNCEIIGLDEWTLMFKMDFDAKVYSLLNGFTRWGDVFEVEVHDRNSDSHHRIFKGMVQLSEGSILLSADERYMSVVFKGLGNLEKVFNR